MAYMIAFPQDFLPFSRSCNGEGAISILRAAIVMPGNMNGNSDAAPNAANRMSYSIGAVSQSDNAGPDVTPPAGDKETMRLYGARVAGMAKKLKG